MGKKRILVADIEPLVDELHGNIAAIARKLGVARQTIYNRVNESTSLQASLESARETMLDEAENVLYEQVLAGNMTAVIFFLKTRGKSRGYTERTEISGVDGGPPVIKVVYERANSKAERTS
jgi:hypothetical protein